MARLSENDKSKIIEELYDKRKYYDHIDQNTYCIAVKDCMDDKAFLGKLLSKYTVWLNDKIRTEEELKKLIDNYLNHK